LPGDLAPDGKNEKTWEKFLKKHLALRFGAGEPVRQLEPRNPRESLHSGGAEHGHAIENPRSNSTNVSWRPSGLEGGSPNRVRPANESIHQKLLAAPAPAKAPSSGRAAAGHPAAGDISFSGGISRDSYSRTEVLAMNLGPVGLDRARALGFEPGGKGSPAVLKVPKGMEALSAARLLREALPGEHFELNRLYRFYQPATKSDSGPAPLFPAPPGGGCNSDHCYAQAAIQWKDQFASCARKVKIGVIDTAADLTHPAFRAQKILHKAFIPDGRSPAADWHGTGVLSLLAGRADSGTPGLAPEAIYHAASIFYLSEDGDSVTDTVSLLRALDWMDESGVRLVNMSFSGPQDNLVEKKIESLSAKGIVFTAAAGNDGPAAGPAYPAAYSQVIAVTAVTKELRSYPYANRGDQIDLAAPGTDIWTAWPDGSEGYRSGTSFAAPFVTGVLALYPPEVLREPKDRLLERVSVADLGPPGRDPVYGRGLLQAPASCPGNAREMAVLRAPAR
jgi:subtilisin family serine protease